MIQSGFKKITEKFSCRLTDIDGLEVVDASEENPVQGLIVYWKGYQTMLPDPDGAVHKMLLEAVSE